MARSPDYYVISYDAGEALPFGFSWLVNIGELTRFSPASASPFRYFATHAEAVACSLGHRFYTNPVCLSDDFAEAA